MGFQGFPGISRGFPWISTESAPISRDFQGFPWTSTESAPSARESLVFATFWTLFVLELKSAVRALRLLLLIDWGLGWTEGLLGHSSVLSLHAPDFFPRARASAPWVVCRRKGGFPGARAARPWGRNLQWPLKGRVRKGCQNKCITRDFHALDLSNDALACRREEPYFLLLKPRKTLLKRW